MTTSNLGLYGLVYRSIVRIAEKELNLYKPVCMAAVLGQRKGKGQLSCQIAKTPSTAREEYGIIGFLLLFMYLFIFQIRCWDNSAKPF